MFETINIGDIVVISDNGNNYHNKLARICSRPDGLNPHELIGLKLINPEMMPGSSDPGILYLYNYQFTKIKDDDIALLQANNDIDRQFIENHLDDNEIRKLCQQILERKISRRVDIVLGEEIDQRMRKIRMFDGKYINPAEDIILDAVFSKIATKYIDEFTEDYHHKIIQQFKDIFSLDPDQEQESDQYRIDGFWNQVQNELCHFLAIYIQKHPTMIRNLLWPNIEKAASKISENIFENVIRESLDIETIVKNIAAEAKVNIVEGKK